MHIAVIADIHGNLPALEAVLADIQRHAVERIINLGDLVSGPDYPWQPEGIDAVMGPPGDRANRGGGCPSQ
jgi:predicted phosphodiesterase